MLNTLVRRLAAFADYRDKVSVGDWTRLRDIIKIQKQCTPIVALAVAVLSTYAPQTPIFAALSYGHLALWLDKEEIYPDKAWRRRVSKRGAITFWLAAFGLHSLVAWRICIAPVAIPTAQGAAALATWAIGATLHFTADWQKYQFKQRWPDKLCRIGLWRWFNAPNYLGEVLIYLGYVLLLPAGDRLLGGVTMLWMLIVVMAPELARRHIHLVCKYGNNA